MNSYDILTSAVVAIVREPKQTERARRARRLLDELRRLTDTLERAARVPDALVSMGIEEIADPETPLSLEARP